MPGGRQPKLCQKSFLLEIESETLEVPGNWRLQMRSLMRGLIQEGKDFGRPKF